MPTLQKTLLNYEPAPENLLPLLKEINKNFGYISQEQVYPIADYFSMSPSKIFSVVSFFDELNFQKKSAIEIKVCMSAPCEMNGSSKVLTEIERFLGTRADRDKTVKLEVTSSSCQGRCQRGPVVTINGTTFEHVTPVSVDDILRPYFQK